MNHSDNASQKRVIFMPGVESRTGMTKNDENRQHGKLMHQFFRTISKMLYAGDFYEGLSQERPSTPPVVFLLICSILFTILSSMFVLKKRFFFALAFFLNSFSMPFITAFILYLVTLLLCKKPLAYKTLFGITAYANITLLFSWIPGVAGPAQILKFCLIGLGMVKTGRISYLRAFVCLLCTGMAMLFLFQLLGSFLGQK